jgi:kinesin family protein C2/C3
LILTFFLLLFFLHFPHHHSEEKLAESSGANAALIAQLESINPQLSQLETALSDTKRKLDTESTARRQAELAQDEAEARAREFEASLDTTKAENDQVHEQLAFREEEVEEMRLELEVEKERHTVELEELATQLASKKGGAKATDEKKDDISVMSEDDFVTMAVGSTDGVANNDDNEDYIKRLEDELEDVTEQLIEAETNISNMEGKLTAAEKNKSDLEKKVVDMESEVDEIQNKLQNSLTEAAAKEEKDAAQASSEEVALLTEELALTQEELKAAEEDAQVAGANLERVQSEHKEQLSKLKAELDSAKNGVNNAKVEVETMEQALNEANSQTSTLRVEVENLMQALKNAKQDHEKTLDDMEALRQAFDEAENDVRETSIQREEDLVKEHNRQLENLVSEIAALTEANNAFKESTTKKSTGPSASEVDLQIKLDQKNSELERTKSDLIEAKDALQKSKRKIEELSAGNKSLINGAFDSPQKMTDILSSPSKMQIVERFNEDDEGAVSIFYRSHARSRSRMPHEPSYRARSSSPSTVCRLERNFNDAEAKALTITKERDSLKSQQRMSDVRVEHLEADIAKLHTKVQEAEQKSDNLVSVVAGVSQNPEARDDKEFLDTEIETIIRDGDKDAVADEFRALARKSTMQKEHNAQLLMRILKLQGNIQVCCRVRPMTNGEIKRATKRVVEPLSDSEVGVFDNRTKSWKSFAFDKVWGPDSHQLGIFQDVEPLALSVVDGYNACIFAYGQT